MFRFVIASEIEPQAQTTKSLHGDKLWNPSMRGGVQREVSNIRGL